MATPLQGTASAASAIDRVKYTHDAMIDLIITKPEISQGELAKSFGYTEPWVSRIINSDAFQARLAERRTELSDPTIVATLEERMKGVMSQSLDVLGEKLMTTRNAELALKVMETTSKALGYGARQNNNVVQNNFVVKIPGKASSSDDWARAYSPAMPAPALIEGE